MEAPDRAAEWAAIATTLAYGLLGCVTTFGVSYVVLRVWPRNHFPRIFSAFASITAVAGLYLLQVPGSGFALVVVLVVMSIIGFGSLDEHGFWLRAGPKADNTSSNAKAAGPRAMLVPLSLGTLFGLVISVLAVSTLLVPPAYLQRWVFHPEPLSQRIERALDPDEQLNALRNREREASATIKKTQGELTTATIRLTETEKRLLETEGELEKARGELGAATSNTIRGIKIKLAESSRHAGGTIYVGVLTPSAGNGFCKMTFSSDRAAGPNDGKYMNVGEAVAIQSSRGKHRLVLTGIARDSCTFDLVKD